MMLIGSLFVEKNWPPGVRFHRLNDGGLLLSFEDNTSHTAYIKESIDSYRLQLNNQAITFEKENDPSLLRAPSAGKLVEFLVDENTQVTNATRSGTVFSRRLFP